MVQITAIFAAVGVVLNRLNISIIAFKWYEPVRYYPSWIEVEVTLAVICLEIWVFRWVVNRMPVLRKYREPENETVKEEEVVKWKASHM